MKAELTKRHDWFFVHFDSAEMLLLNQLADAYKEPKERVIARIVGAGLNLQKSAVFPEKHT